MISNSYLAYAAIVSISYLIGSIPFGLVLGKLFKVGDIRQIGLAVERLVVDHRQLDSKDSRGSARSAHDARHALAVVFWRLSPSSRGTAATPATGGRAWAPSGRSLAQPAPG